MGEKIIEDRSAKWKEMLPDYLMVAPVQDKAYFIFRELYAFDPKGFELLEGFTRCDGRVVFISSNNQKIRNSGNSARALPISDSKWFVNPHMSHEEARRFFERVVRTMNLPIGLKMRIDKIIKSK